MSLQAREPALEDVWAVGGGWQNYRRGGSGQFRKDLGEMLVAR